MVFNIAKDLLYSNTRNSWGALGRAVAAEHFTRDTVVISKGLKGLEKKIREDETVVTAITMLQKSLTKNRKKILI